MAETTRPRPMEKLETGIPGLDHVTMGGLPRGRSTLVAGTAGAAKTVLAAQFLAAGIARGEAGVFLTFEESPEQLRRNLAGFGWDVAAWEADGRWAFVDASPSFEEETITVGAFDLAALLARVEHTVRGLDARRVAVDSLGAVFAQLVAGADARRELLRLTAKLRELEVTGVITAERPEQAGDAACQGLEEFVADNVVILRNTLEVERRRRTLEVLKLRGCPHRKGQHPFSVMEGEGVVVIPLTAMELTQSSSQARISIGNAAVDAMCGGGLFRDSIVLASGATGTGKTLLATGFVAAGAASGERGVVFGFEESRAQLVRNASSWGYDFPAMETDGLLELCCDYPEARELEDHLITIKRTVDEFRPRRVAVDSLTALERVSTPRAYREFVVALTSFLKQREITGLFTSTSGALLGGESITDAHISTITDTILLLRYVEMFGEMRRGLTVLKMRGSAHDKAIRQFTIDSKGIHVGEAFRNTSGIIGGQPVHMSPGEMERLEEMRTARQREEAR